MRRLFALMLLLAAPSGAFAQRADPTLIIEAGGHSRFVKMVAFTRDGDHLVTVGDDNAIRVWDKDSRRLVKVISCRGGGGARRRIKAAALSPDDRLVAVAGDFRDAGAERYAVHLYELETGRLLPTLGRHTDAVTALAFSADGRYLASGASFGDRGVLVWDMAAVGGPALAAGFQQSHDDAVTSLAFSPDGTLLASGSDDNMVRVWDWAKKEGARPLRKLHAEAVKAVAFSPDARYVASGGMDKKVILWDLKENTAKSLGSQGGGMWGFTRIFGMGARDEEAKRPGALQGGVWEVVFSPDGKRLLVGTTKGGCELYDLPAGTSAGSCKRVDTVAAAAFSPDSEDFATSGGFDGEVYVEELNDKRCVVGEAGGKTDAKPCRALAGRGRTVWSVGFAPDGSALAFGNRRAAEDPRHYGPLEHVFNLKQGDAYKLSLGGAASGAESGLVRSTVSDGVYELRTRFGQRLGADPLVYDRELQILKGGKPHKLIALSSESGYVHKSFTLTGDGRVVSGAEDGYLTMYNAETGAKEMDFAGHTGDVWAVAVSKNNRLLVSGSSDQTVRVWDIKSGTNLLTIFVAEDYEWVASTPEGYYASSLSGDRYVGWMYRREGEVVPQFYRASQFQRVYYRPDVVAEYMKTSEYLQRPNIGVALEQANERTGGQFLSGAQGAAKLSQMSDPVKLTQSLPPKIQLVGDAGLAGRLGEMVTGSPLLRLKFSVVSHENLPITEVGVFLNGMRKGSFKGDADDPQRGTRLDIEMQLHLEQPENTLHIVASNARATSRPEVLRVLYKPGGAGEPRPPVRAPAAAKPFDRRSEARPARGPLAPSGVRFEPASFAEPAAPRQTVTPEIQVLRPTAVPATVEDNELMVELKVNFKRPCPAPDDKCNVVRATLDGAEVFLVKLGRAEEELQLPVPLKNEETENVLRITASNGEAESAPVEWKFNFRPRVAAKPNLIFLGIGVQQFKHFSPPLSFARRDAEKMAEYMKTQDESGPHGQSALYRKVIADLILDEKASLAAIHDGLKWVNDQTRHENDLRVVFISTHGGASQESGKYYLYSHLHESTFPAGTSLDLTDLWLILGRGKGKTILLIDACRDGAPKIDDMVHFVKVVNQDKNRDGRLIAFLASGVDQPSYEKPELQHGVFTYAVLRGLSEEAKSADAPFDEEERDGRITLEELRNWIVFKVNKLDRRQHPSPLVPEGMTPFPLYLYKVTP